MDIIMSKSYLKINPLMKHLRSSGININGTYQKQQLVNYGYYHGYKGYRFFGNPSKQIGFADFKELIAVIKYDNKLKALFYPHLMFIETALKNITLDIVLQEANSNGFNDVFDRIMPGYTGAWPSASLEQKKKLQKNKLFLQSKIRSQMLNAYDKDNKIIAHFYNSRKHEDVPLWAIFEVLTLGDFGAFVGCLNQITREKISRYIGLDLSGDTNRMLIKDIIFVIKDLRNAVAHNDIVFDTRFKKSVINRPLKTCMTHDVGVTYANFQSIIDYIILVAYILKKIKVPKKEILSMISSYEKCLKELQKEVGNLIYLKLVHVDTSRKIGDLRRFVSRS